MNYEEAIKSAYQHHEVTDMSDIINALHYAQKEHELLGLKNKHISHLQSLYASTISHNSKLVNQWSAEVQKVQSEIWKLEKELEERK